MFSGPWMNHVYCSQLVSCAKETELRESAARVHTVNAAAFAIFLVILFFFCMLFFMFLEKVRADVEIAV